MPLLKFEVFCAIKNILYCEWIKYDTLLLIYAFISAYSWIITSFVAYQQCWISITFKWNFVYRIRLWFLEIYRLWVMSYMTMGIKCQILSFCWLFWGFSILRLKNLLEKSNIWGNYSGIMPMVTIKTENLTNS